MTVQDELMSTIKICLESADEFETKYPEQSKFLLKALEFASTFPNILLGKIDEWDADDQAISEILNQGLFDLKDSICNLYLGNLKLSMITLRCFLENMFYAIYYREQAIDFALWRRSPNDFVMLHQLYDEKHLFRKYFRTIFEDRKDEGWDGNSKFSKKIFITLEKLYSSLSWSVHGRPDQREETQGKLSLEEVNIYRQRLETTISICYEFINIVGTCPIDDVSQEFKFTKEKVL